MASHPAAQVPARAPYGAAGKRGTLCVRDATAQDMDAVQRIYAHHVLHGSATFEEQPPTVEEMLARRQHVLDLGMPYLVAEVDDQVVGYAYAAPYRPRVAYRYTLEDSIYLAPGQAGQGWGKALLGELIRRCEHGPWRQMIAVIAGAENRASINLHRSVGFTHSGIQPATGFKFGQWIDVVFMQRSLGPGSSTPPTDIP